MLQSGHTMRAVVLTGHGGLEYREDVSRPDPAPGEVRIRVGATAVNNTDINTRTAWYVEDVTTGNHRQGRRRRLRRLRDRARGNARAIDSEFSDRGQPRRNANGVCGMHASVELR